MKSFNIASLLAVLLVAATTFTVASAFAPIHSSSVSVGGIQSRVSSSSFAPVGKSSTKLFFFGQPKDDGSPGDYVCKVSFSL